MNKNSFVAFNWNIKSEVGTCVENFFSFILVQTLVFLLNPCFFIQVQVGNKSKTLI